jgi:hypothetical protein
MRNSHNSAIETRQETPLFAASIERAALKKRGDKYNS